MAERQAVHKSGPLKQQNKSHKHGKHRTKGQITALTKGKPLLCFPTRASVWFKSVYKNGLFSGRVSVKVQTRKAKREIRKADRKNKV